MQTGLILITPEVNMQKSGPIFTACLSYRIPARSISSVPEESHLSLELIMEEVGG